MHINLRRPVLVFLVVIENPEEIRIGERPRQQQNRFPDAFFHRRRRQPHGNGVVVPGGVIECCDSDAHSQQVDDYPPEAVCQDVAYHAEAIENGEEDYRFGIRNIHPGVRAENGVLEDGLHAVHS